MAQAASTEFHKRWIATAEADIQSAKRSFFIWFCLFITNAAVCLSIQFFLQSRWRLVALLVCFIPSLVSFVKMALSASDLGDAKKFLRECRIGLANEAQSIR
jgi:hypothetical protein